MLRTIPSSGPLNARLAIVGEAPGSEEARLGRPFVGSSGNLAQIMAASAGISWDNCRLLNVMEIRPPNNSFEKTFYNSDSTPNSDLIRGRERLKSELKELKPNLILMLGREPLKALTGKSKIGLWRGTLFQTDCGKALATFHPSYILRQYENRPIGQIDWFRAAEEMLSPHLTRPTLNRKIMPTYEEVMDFLDTEPTMCTFDIETLGRYVRCLGFGYNSNSAICIPFIRVNPVSKQPNIIHLTPTSLVQGTDPSYWTEDEELYITKAICKFFRNENIRFVAQNFDFDIPVLEENLGIRIANIWFDTLHAHHTAYLELPKSLDYLTSVYTKIGYYADYSAKSDTETWIYNCTDCIATYQSVEAILKDLEDLKMKDFYFEHVHPECKALARVGQTGIVIDTENREKLAAPLLADMKELTDKNLKRFNRKVKVTRMLKSGPKTDVVDLYTRKMLGSWVQVREVLQNELKISIPTRMKKQTTDEQALRGLMTRHHDEEFLHDVLSFREKQKFYGTYVTAEIDADGRMRTSFNTSGTNTGRISSSQTIWKTGGNLQNIPKTNFRRLFTVPEGYTLIHADLSQAESRVVAWLCRDMELIERFAHDKTFDVHRFSGSRIYGISESDITGDQRERSKRCNHSGNYGIAYKKFAYVADLEITIARDVLQRYQANPFLKNWWESTKQELRSSRTLVSPFGRRKIFYGRLDEETFRQGYAFKPQSTVGDIVNRAVYVLDAALDPDIARLVLTVHDEVDVECRTEYVAHVIPMIREAMTYPLMIEPIKTELVIPVDISTGPNWWDQTDYEEQGVFVSGSAN